MPFAFVKKKRLIHLPSRDWYTSITNW